MGTTRSPEILSCSATSYTLNLLVSFHQNFKNKTYYWCDVLVSSKLKERDTKLWIYENHIGELRGEEFIWTKIIAVTMFIQFGSQTLQLQQGHCIPSNYLGCPSLGFVILDIWKQDGPKMKSYRLCMLHTWWFPRGTHKSSMKSRYPLVNVCIYEYGESPCIFHGKSH